MVKEALKITPPSNNGIFNVDWYALEYTLANVAQIPSRIGLFPPDKDGKTYALISTQGQLSETVPPGTNPNGVGQNIEQLDDLSSSNAISSFVALINLMQRYKQICFSPILLVSLHRSTWHFWANFLFQLSVPTMGKPEEDYQQ